MIDRLPEGTSIGWMQAPPQWIFTHTVRFVGIVRVVIQDGEGFILIQKGKPLAYYFKHGRIELRGHAALDYFNSHPTIEFNLCKYSAEEFEEALRIYTSDEQVVTPPQPERRTSPAAAPRPVSPPAAPDLSPPPQPVESIRKDTEESLPGAIGHAGEPEPVLTEEPPQARQIPRSVPPPPPPSPEQYMGKESEKHPPIPASPAVLDEPTLHIIGQIKKLNGVVAISVFNDDRNILLMGDVEIEPLLKIARSLLATSRKISPLLEWGSFVHMTLQIPEGNVIVAPYQDNYLCLLTTRTINIGHIRRILRDLQISGA